MINTTSSSETLLLGIWPQFFTVCKLFIRHLWFFVILSILNHVIRLNIKTQNNTDKHNHRLNGSSSPVLTATCLSYGSLCDFLTFFPQPTWRSHPSTNFDAKWLKRRGFMQGCAFCSKNRKILYPLTPSPPKRSKFGLRFSGSFADIVRSANLLTYLLNFWT